jgi:hypothetical protein
MMQRVPGRAWYSPGRPGHRPKVLVEDDAKALEISDFSVFQQAGFDVAFCSGPGRDPQDCPLLHGQQCDVLAEADAVLHRLDPALGLAAAIRQSNPDAAVVVEEARDADGRLPAVLDGCQPLAYPCSVRGQVEALREALASRHGAPQAQLHPRQAADSVRPPGTNR